MSTPSPGLPLRGFPPASIGNSLESKYRCSSCKYVLRNPVQSYCGHRYCRTCVERLLSEVSSVMCQSCIEEHNEEEEITIDRVFPDNATKRELYALSATCVNQGCNWNGRLKELEKHERACVYRLDECECGSSFSPEVFAEHLQNECSHRLVSCQYCKVLVKFLNTQSHKRGCQLAPTRCPKCGEEGIIRKDLESHMKMPGCRPRIKCSYGCGEMVEESVMDEHIQLKFRVHLDAIYGKMHQVNCKVEEKVSEMQDAIHLLSSVTGGGGATGGSEEEQMDTDDNENLATRVDLIDRKLTISENVGKVLKREIQRAMRIIETANSDRDADRDRIEALERSMNSLTTSGRMNSLGTSGRVNSLGTSGPPVMLGSIGTSSMEAPLPTSTNGILTWVLEDFLQKRQNAASGVQMVMTSQPFFTSPNGYKLCGRIYPNGDGVGKSNYLSLFLVIMRGPNDNTVKWPFRQKVTMTLEDQGPRKNHIVDSFRPDPASGSFQRPGSEYNTASGCPMFAKQATICQVGNHEYIKNGKIIITIKIDIVGI